MITRLKALLVGLFGTRAARLCALGLCLAMGIMVTSRNAAAAIYLYYGPHDPNADPNFCWISPHPSVYQNPAIR